MRQHLVCGAWCAAAERPTAVAVTLSHPFGAITGLIGTCKNAETNDPALDKALQSAIAYLLKAEKKGGFANDAQLYTILYGEDYYDADTSTTCFVASALQLYRDFVKIGPEKAMESSSL